ncbi:hypothetical protein [Rhodococcus chondri]|uniref:Uncharacterized protein n=1 Tax=Rhodococcus chondri TaxID=3065941 RepID=A0ABU7JWX3_9NOCA|nr:hypothetical protein [Rhodococcus sp. CC-R104]MEE2034523.1 hypothetical protein [Rhodococcus sp. CC-R104]
MTESSDAVRSNAIEFDSAADTDSEADRIEQSIPVYDDPADVIPPELPLESDPADTVDQYREVPGDEDYPRQ